MAGTSTTKLRILVLVGSTREGRQGLRVAGFVKKELEEHCNCVADILDPSEIPFPVLEKPLQSYSDPTQAPDWLVATGKKIQEADAIVVVSAEYNHSIPPALTNTVDHFPLSYFSFKPSGIVCYSTGPFGGVRAAMQLRCLLSELGCISVPDIFAIPLVHEAFDEDGKAKKDDLKQEAQRFIGQLDWHARAMKAHRDTHGVPSRKEWL